MLLFILDDLTSAMKHQPFSIYTDGSNGPELEIINPITVQIYDVRRGRIVNCFFDMCKTANATAEAIYTALNEKIY